MKIIIVIRNFFGIVGILTLASSMVILFKGGSDRFFALGFVSSMIFTIIFLRLDRVVNGTIPHASKFAKKYF